MTTAPPGPEQARLAKVMSGVYAATLALEALTLLLVPRAVAQAGGVTGMNLTITLGLAAALLVLAGRQRRPWGLSAGSVAQVAFIATGFIVPAMFFLGAVFGFVWLYTIRCNASCAAAALGMGVQPPGLMVAGAQRPTAVTDRLAHPDALSLEDTCPSAP